MTYLLIRQRCCLSGDGVGTTQLLQLWCHHAAALLVSVECHFLPAARPRKTLKRRSLAGRTILRPKPRVASASKVRTHATKASRIVCHSHSSPARQAQQPDKRLEIASALRQTKVVDWKCSTEQLSEQVQYRNAWILNLEESMAEHLTTMHRSGNNPEGLCNRVDNTHPDTLARPFTFAPLQVAAGLLSSSVHMPRVIAMWQPKIVLLDTQHTWTAVKQPDR